MIIKGHIVLGSLLSRVKHFCDGMRGIAWRFGVSGDDILMLYAAEETLREKIKNNKLIYAERKQATAARTVIKKKIVSGVRAMVADIKSRKHWADDYAKLLGVYTSVVDQKHSIKHVKNKTGYIPKNIGGMLTWFKNFCSALQQIAPRLQLAEADIKHLLGICEQFITAADKAEIATVNHHKALEETTAAAKYTRRLFNKIVVQTKKSPNWTNDFAKMLGVDKMELDDRARLANFRPRGELKDRRTHVSIKFLRIGIDGVNVYTRMAGEPEFIFFRYANRIPFVDPRLVGYGIAEEREYQLRGVLDGKEVGQPSEVLSITLGLAVNLDPLASLNFFGSFVKLSFIKKGIVGYGINVYSRMEEEKDFTFLGHTKTTPFKDPRQVTAGIGEVREYLVRSVIDGKEVGEPSDILSMKLGSKMHLQHTFWLDIMASM